MTTPRRARYMVLPLLIAAVLALGAVAEPAKSDGKDDVVLSAMRAELERSKSQLKMDQVAAPYYVEYRIFDVDEYGAEASFGALRGDVRTRFRFLRVVVRIWRLQAGQLFRPRRGHARFHAGR